VPGPPVTTVTTGPSGVPSATPSGTPDASGGTPTPGSTATASPSQRAPHPVSLQAMMQKRYDGRDLRVGRALARNSEYTRYFVTYASGPLRISGILNVPAGRGPFPALVLNHGYIDPAIYTNGRGLMREQDYLARAGYIVLHTDYRNHAQSSDDPQSDLNLRLGYTEDVINAVLALRSSSLPVDKPNIGLLGRSMGGGITYNLLVAQPGLVKAAVVFASAQIIGRYGSPEQNPAFWRNLASVNFFDRITEPLLIHHGTDDESCPIAWSRETLAALQRQGKTATMHTYQGEHHAFGPQWPLSMRRTVAFLDARLK
jgi:dipeptidyl aminopeptidase/acylaminoacyl peptidase